MLVCKLLLLLLLLVSLFVCFNNRNYHNDRIRMG